MSAPKEEPSEAHWDWYDVRDWDQNVVNFGKNVGGRTIDVGAFTVNAPMTAWTAGLNQRTGGDCDLSAHLTVVCYGGALTALAPNGGAITTWGTINARLERKEYALANNAELPSHETWHTRQFAILGGGLGLPLLYGLESLRSSVDPNRNLFEVQAGLESGGYTK